MATANDRINAIEGNMAAMMEMMAAIAANTGNGVTTVDSDDSDSDDSAIATANTGKTKKATATGWRATAEVMPESVKRTRQDRDPNSRCSLEQASYAANIVSQWQGLAKRVTDGIVWYSGIKRELPDATDKAGTKAEAQKRAQYEAHLNDATASMLAAFNLYSDDATFDPDNATYGELWDYLSTHAPVSLQKAKREHAAEAKRNGNGA
jgi:hypothetical protein